MKFRFVAALSVFLPGASWASWAVAQAPTSPSPQAAPTATAPVGTPVSAMSSPGYTTSAPPGSAAPITNGPPAQPWNAPPASQSNCPAPVLPSGAFNGSGHRGSGLWFDAEYLLWKIKNDSIPQVTVFTPAGIAAFPNPASTATLTGATGTVTTASQLTPVFLQSSSSLPQAVGGDHSGGRFSAGYWFGDDQSVGIEGRVFYLENLAANSAIFTNNNSADTTFTAATGQTNTVLVTGGTTTATPIVFLGQANSAALVTSAKQMWGAELNGRCIFLEAAGIQFGGVAGFRYLQFHELLTVNDSTTLTLTPTDTPVVSLATPNGTTIPITSAAFNVNSLNSITTYNNFYGAQVGADFNVNIGRFFVDTRGTLGLGVMNQQVNINGSNGASLTTTTTPTTVVGTATPGTPTTTTQSITQPGGLFAGPSDLGNHGRNRLAFLPELTVKVGYDVTDWFRLFVGFDTLYVSNVVRPSLVTGQSSTNVTATVAGTTQHLTVNQPSFRFSDTNIWAYGITFGAQFQF
jgi:Putative beta barrel porin-7 (BBP7)